MSEEEYINKLNLEMDEIMNREESKFNQLMEGYPITLVPISGKRLIVLWDLEQEDNSVILGKEEILALIEICMQTLEETGKNEATTG